MGKILIFIAVLISVVLFGCGFGSEPVARQSIEDEKAEFHTYSFGLEGPRGPAGPAGPAGPPGAAGAEGAFDFADADVMRRAPAATPAPMAAQAPSAAMEPGLEESGEASSQLQTAQRRVISTASITIEVEAVQETVSQVRVIAESLGGFIEQLSSSGGSQQQQAFITIRVPQDQFFSALERLEGLGEVQNRNMGSEDVSERFIDLEARLKSAQREEESLLSLLGRAQQVSDVLTIERELSRVRSEIERLQGQLNFLERRVELATISISLVPPQEEFHEPPSASMSVELSDVSGRVNEVKNLVSTLGGEVDRVLLSSREGQERADISFRVFPKDFGQAIEFLEDSGKVRSKELREGTNNPTNAEPPEEPNASIGVSLIEPAPSNTGLIIAIAAPIGGVVLLVALAAAFYFTYQAGRHRRERFAQ